MAKVKKTFSDIVDKLDQQALMDLALGVKSDDAEVIRKWLKTKVIPEFEKKGEFSIVVDE